MKEILENSRKIISNDRTVFASSSDWTDKRRVYFEVYKKLLENCYPIETILNIGIGPNLSALKWNKIISDLWPCMTYLENLDLDKLAIKKAKDHNNPLISNVYYGDIKDLESLYDENSFDLIYWNQGPEHIYREERESTFRGLEKVASKAIFMHCPWGSGYDYDKWHYSKNIQKGEFESFGFTCMYHGKINTKTTGIMSYKIL